MTESRSEPTLQSHAGAAARHEADPAASEAGFERSDTRTSVIGWIMLVSVLIIAGAIGGLFLLLGQMRSRDRAGPALTAQQRAAIVAPGPPLQDQPLADIAALRARESERLTSYAWLDDAHRRARIPIDRAMTLVVGQSLEPNPAAGSPDEALAPMRHPNP